MAGWLLIIGLACGIAAALYIVGWAFLSVRWKQRAEEREAWVEYQKGWIR